MNKLMLAFGALSALLATSLVTPPMVEAAPSRPERPQLPKPQPPPNYTGLYALTYTTLSGDVEICVYVGPQRSCAPIAIDIPLFGGQATADSMVFIEDYLVSELSTLAPNLPAEYYPDFDALVAYLYPALVEELNLFLGELPTALQLHELPGSPLVTASMTMKGLPVLLPGQIEIPTGAFRLLQDVMTGSIDHTHNFLGNARAEVPIMLNQSVGFTTPAGQASTIGVSMRGRGSASMVMVRQEPAFYPAR